MRLADRPHYIYRHFAPCGTLLYVGLTVHPTVRPWVRWQRPWVDDTIRVEVSGPLDRADALAGERRAIRDEEPVHNKRMNNGNVTASERYWDDASASMTDEDWKLADAHVISVLSDALAPALGRAS
jgi:hypothetical protein